VLRAGGVHPAGHRGLLELLARALLERETLDEAYVAAGIDRDTAPGGAG
jgi:hypothetical protein